MLPLLTRVMRKTSPTRPRRIGPGTPALKVMRIWVTPAPTCITCSVTVKVCSWTAVEAPAGASAGSKPLTSAGRTTA